MMRTTIKTHAVGIALLCMFTLVPSTDVCFAGAWTMGENAIYTRLTANYYHAKAVFDADGDRRDFPLDGEFRDLYLNNYVEFGLTDSVTLIGSLYYKSIKKQDDAVEQKTWGIGDIDVGTKMKLVDRPWGVLATQALIKIPGPYDIDDDLPLGNGQIDLEVKMLYGRSLYPHFPGYVNGELGYRWRFEDPSDEVRYLIEVGVDLTRNFYGRIKLDGVYSMDNGRHFDIGGNPKIANNYDLGKLDVVLGVKIDRRWGIEIGYMPEIYGQNTSAGTTYTVALTYHVR